MKTSLTLRLKRSIFTKLFLIYLLTTCAVLCAVVAFFKLDFPGEELRRQAKRRSMIEYAHFLLDRLGDPHGLDEAALRKFAAERGVQIWLREGGRVRLSSKDLPSYEELPIERAEPPSEIMARIGFLGRHRFVAIAKPGLQFVVFFGIAQFDDERAMLYPLLVLAVITILGLSYMAVRHLFRPLQVLRKGMEHVAQGRFDRPITIDQNDELGELARCFDLMTGKIREMLRHREQLLIDVSHELRAPLARLKLALEMDSSASCERSKRYVRELEKMVGELLESAAIDNEQGGLRLASENLVAIIEGTMALYGNVSPGVIFTKSVDRVMANVDRDRLQIVLKNVIDNALKYSANQSRPVEVHVAQLASARAQIMIDDFGIGVPPAERKAIFEPFYRVDKSRVRQTGGYGLGLSLCQKIMTAHGGSVVVTEHGGCGTRVLLTI